jgi:hypothetical protein
MSLHQLMIKLSHSIKLIQDAAIKTQLCLKFSSIIYIILNNWKVMRTEICRKVMRFWMFSKPYVRRGWAWEEIKGVKISCKTVQNMHARCEDHPWHLHFLNKIVSSCKCEIIFSLFGNHHDGVHYDGV